MTQLQRRASGFQLEDRGELTLLTLCTLGAAFLKNAYGRGRHWDVSPAPLQRRELEAQGCLVSKCR